MQCFYFAYNDQLEASCGNIEIAGSSEPSCPLFLHQDDLTNIVMITYQPAESLEVMNNPDNLGQTKDSTRNSGSLSLGSDPFKGKPGFSFASKPASPRGTTPQYETRSSPKRPTVSPTSPRTPSHSDTNSSFFSDSSSSSSESPVSAHPRLRLSTSESSGNSVCRPRPSQVLLPPPPSLPDTWKWQCHICKERYSLSVTRRCLNDGHLYCSDESSYPKKDPFGPRKGIGQSCTSEFDYVGWARWGAWKKRAIALDTYSRAPIDKQGIVKVRNPVIRGCKGCDFPSQCRHQSKAPQEEIDILQYLDSTPDNEVIGYGELDQDASREVKRSVPNVSSDLPGATRNTKKTRNTLGLRINSAICSKSKNRDVNSKKLLEQTTEEDEDEVTGAEQIYELTIESHDERFL